VSDVAHGPLIIIPIHPQQPVVFCKEVNKSVVLWKRPEKSRPCVTALIEISPNPQRPQVLSIYLDLVTSIFVFYSLFMSCCNEYVMNMVGAYRVDFTSFCLCL
jgi:hypothetical protein